MYRARYDQILLQSERPLPFCTSMSNETQTIPATESEMHATVEREQYAALEGPTLPVGSSWGRNYWTEWMLRPEALRRDDARLFLELL